MLGEEEGQPRGLEWRYGAEEHVWEDFFFLTYLQAVLLEMLSEQYLNLNMNYRYFF